MPMRAKKKSRSRTSVGPRVTKDPQLNGFYDGLKGIPPRSDTQKYMAVTEMERKLASRVRL